MVIVDTNVLVYAVDDTSPNSRQSIAWLDGALAGAETVGFAWTTLLAFLRLTTSNALFEAPLRIDEAIDQIDEWTAASAAVIVEPGPRHAALLRDVLAGAGATASGRLAGDAHLAALAIENRADVVTFDRDFARFAGVRSRPPQ